jgi:hypothetical protein
MQGLPGTATRLPAVALAAAMVLSLNQTPATPQAPAVRFHHLHFQTDDFAGALAAAAGAHAGVRTILEGLGPGVRAGDVYLLFERPPDDPDRRAGERREPAGSRVDAAVEWLRTRGLGVSVSEAARRIIDAPPGDAPLAHVAFAAEDVGAVERALRAAAIEPVRRTTVSVFYEAGGETVEITAETDRPDAFWCPMHPNVRAPGATRCPICAMDLVPIAPPRAGEYRLDVAPRPAAGGRGASGLRLRIRDPATGRDVAMFAEAHERLLHLFIIGRDLEFFAHEHPERTAGGFELATRLPPGAYMVIADFIPGGGYPQMVHRAIVTPGHRGSPFARAPRLAPDLSEKLREGMRIRLRVEAAGSRPEAVLRFHVSDAQSGAPITDLQPYLGAAGHVLIVSPDLTNAVHAHPDASGAGPDFDVHAVFPQAGTFKLWVQVQRRGKVVTAPFTVQIGP